MDEGSGIHIEVPGFKIEIRGKIAATTLIIITAIICGLIGFIFERDPESVMKAAEIFGKGATTAKTEEANDLIVVWIPGQGDHNPNFDARVDAFESWMNKNVDWWGKSPWTNIRRLEEGPVAIQGWEYRLEFPYEDSDLSKGNPASKALIKANQIFDIEDDNLAWSEIVRIAEE